MEVVGDAVADNVTVPIIIVIITLKHLRFVAPLVLANVRNDNSMHLDNLLGLLLSSS